MNILIFSGTTEGREISYRLAEMGHRVTVSVATVFGRAAQESGRTAQKETAGPVQVLQGRLEEADMARVLSGFDLCIDATHPYATAAGENIRKAADEAGVRLLRLQREESPVPEGAIGCERARQAAELLKDTEGNILLTCGVKSLVAFSEIERKRLIVRIIPSEESLRQTLQADIPPANIIAMEGPFSAEFNELLIREKQIRYLVTKDGGRAGGFPEKVKACGNCGTALVLIKRPAGREGLSMDRILDIVGKSA